jgi:hypothetical protein
MPVFVVSYDLTRPRTEDYQKLWDALGRMNAKRVLLSQYAMHYGGTAAGLRDHLWAFMDANDRLLVMARDTGDWAGMRTYTNLNDV